MQNFVKVPATAETRRHFPAISGMVVLASEVPEGCSSRPATAFEVLTQTVACSVYGANMGRPGIGSDIPAGVRVFDRVVPLRGDYDQGGAYWGAGPQRLRVRYTKDLSFVRYYRETFEYNVYGDYVYGDYGYGPEVVTSASSYQECKGFLNDYRENEPGVRFFYLRERVVPSF